jgi:ABC-type multidrug transport system fused ATPase/permease subunit
MQETIPRKPLAFALFVTKEFWPWALGAMCAVTVASALDGWTNLVLKDLINAMMATFTSTPKDFGRVWFWAIAYTAVFTAAGLCWRVNGFNAMRWLTNVKAKCYRVLFTYLTRHSANYFSSRFSGALASRVSNVAEGIENILENILWQFLPLVIFVIVGVYVTSTASIFFSVILCVWVVLFLATNITLLMHKRKRAQELAAASADMRGAVVDSAANIMAVHQTAREDFEIAHLQSYIDRFRKANLRNWLFSESILVIGNLLQMVFIASIFGSAVYFLERGLITVGDVAMLTGVMIQMIRQIVFIGNQLNRFMDDFGQASEGLQELLLPHEITDPAHALGLSIHTGEIEFRDVDFSYGKQNVFRHFHLLIPAGQKVGLVGQSGAGKTSLTGILLRQFDIQSGDILIDGQSIRSVQQRSIREHIAIVPQDTSLFHRTVRENIRYGKLDATDTEIEDAAALAQAHEFIKTLPKGYDTLVGERGVKLSGGQRQRIAIARAILKNAPILLLDEATSALDSESEACIQSALRELMKQKTVIAIAHRLSTLREMDRIIVLDGGIVVEDGTHQELLDRQGIYAKLWASQVGGFIQE